MTEAKTKEETPKEAPLKPGESKKQEVVDPGPDVYAYIEDPEAREALREADKALKVSAVPNVKELEEIAAKVKVPEAVDAINAAIGYLKNRFKPEDLETEEP